MNNKFLLFAAAAAALAACTQMEKPAESGVPVTLSYSTVNAVETKAAQDLNEGTFASGESVKVLISSTGAGEWDDYTFTTGSAGAMNAPDPAPYYPAGDQNIDIAAYYPADASTSFTVATDQTADADYKASDLMFASVTNQAKQADAVNLEFSHKMAKLCVNITPGSGVSSISSVSILNVKPTVSFDQATGAVGEAEGTAATIAMSNNGAAVIPAQTIDGELLSIVTDKGTATYTVSSKAFEAGKVYTINITVNLRAVGTTTAITGWTSEGTVTVNPVSRVPGGLEAVDLGLSVKWANMNVGAECETDYGAYFAWGETIGYYVIGSTLTPASGNVKTTYDWTNYALCNGTETSMLKYCLYDDDGTVDNITVLKSAHDAASANWGGSWRMPTYVELNELRSGTDIEYVADYNGTGVSGLKVINKTDATKFIFLPFAGFINGSTVDDGGYYWSSSLDEWRYSYRAVYMSLNSSGYPSTLQLERYYGLAVRAVQP